MRKLLFIMLTVVMCITMGLVAVNGISFANVLGIKQIKEKNQQIRSNNEKLSKLVDVDYPNAIKNLEDAEKQLKSTKEEYESQIALTADSGTGYLATTEKYEIEFLWTRIGNHALDNDVDIKIDLTNSSTSGLYKLNFEVTGSYVGITDFIYSIENDSKLGFKIDNFVATANATTTTADTENKVAAVKATFSCDEVGINVQSIESQTSTGSDTTTNTTAETNNTNTTNTTTNSMTTTNNTSTTNVTNSTNADSANNTTSNTANSTTTDANTSVNSTTAQ